MANVASATGQTASVPAGPVATSEGEHALALAFLSSLATEVSKGTVSGDTWTWTSSQSYGGQEIKQKMTIKVLTPASYSMKFELSMDGTSWMTFMDGKATKK